MRRKIGLKTLFACCVPKTSSTAEVAETAEHRWRVRPFSAFSATSAVQFPRVWSLPSGSPPFQFGSWGEGPSR